MPGNHDIGQSRTFNFASDNNSAVCPEAWAALERINGSGHETGYGADPLTAQARRMIAGLFETDCEVHFVFNGTAANALALAATVPPYRSVICRESAHIANDECGAVGFFSGGASLRTLGGTDAKLDPAAVEAACRRRTDVHSQLPAALSVTQATEAGSVYQTAELRALSEVAKSNGLYLHMDGARFANAAAALGESPADMTWRSGVDILSLGATKNGLAIGEAIVVFNKSLRAGLDARIKQAGQLASKMRFMSGAWTALLNDDCWLRHARHANAMARLLSDRLRETEAVRVAVPATTNMVFVDMPQGLAQTLRGRGWHFYEFFQPNRYRLVTSWDTPAEAVEDFIADLRLAARTP